MSDHEKNTDPPVAPAAAATPEPPQDRHTANRLIRELFILAALWLPLGFFLWFFFGSFLIRPAVLVGNGVFALFAPEVVSGLVQNGFQIDVNTPIRLERMVEGRFALLSFTINPLIYAYGVPLLFGLVMATPRLSAGRRVAQILGGYLVLLLVQVWGIFWEILKDMSFSYGSLAAGAVADTGIPLSVIALCYQLGYLILPAVVPIVLWILMNRPFLESIALTRRRP